MDAPEEDLAPSDFNVAETANFYGTQDDGSVASETLVEDGGAAAQADRVALKRQAATLASTFAITLCTTAINCCAHARLDSRQRSTPWQALTTAFQGRFSACTQRSVMSVWGRLPCRNNNQRCFRYSHPKGPRLLLKPGEALDHALVDALVDEAMCKW